MGAAGLCVTAAVRDAYRGRVQRAGDDVSETVWPACVSGTDALLDELACHMRAAGEISADGEVRVDDADLEGVYVLEQKAKLVWMAGADAAYVVPAGQDWAHDALGEAIVVPGMLYSDDEPFLEGDACVSGYFQADVDGRWARVRFGRVPAGAAGVAWRGGLEEFPEVMAQLEECMNVSGYRHVAEQAALRALVDA